MLPDTFQARFETYDGQRLRLWSVDPEEADGRAQVRRDLAAAAGRLVRGYQAEFETATAQGFRLHRVRGYADSGRFAVIWRKP